AQARAPLPEDGEGRDARGPRILRLAFAGASGPSCRSEMPSRTRHSTRFDRSTARSPGHQGERPMNPRQFKRRQFLKAAGIGVAATAIAKPAIAQINPAIKWRLTSSFPKSLDTLYGAMETIAKFVAESTDNQFRMETFAAGEIVPGLNAMDAVSRGTVEACHTAAYYYFGKDPTFALFCAVPFGLNTRQQNAWFYDGDGMKLMNEFGKKFNIYSLVAGNTGCQM